MIKYIYVVFLLLIIVLFYSLSKSYPNRWDENFIGKNMDTIYLVLGYPDAPLSEFKGWDSWTHSIYVGAFVLKVYEENDKVVKVSNKFVLGNGHKKWIKHYKVLLENDKAPSFDKY